METKSLINNEFEKFKSPCTKFCHINDKNGYCRGCFRTVDEIAMWIYYSLQEKEDLLKKIELRKKGNIVN